MKRIVIYGSRYGTARQYAGELSRQCGIDYAKLCLKHRMMMAMLCKKIKSMPEESLRAEDRALLETYNQKVDFADFAPLAPLRDALRT